MPRYKIQDTKTGRIIEIEGDSPPTEAEMEQIFMEIAPPPVQNSQATIARATELAGDLAADAGGATAGQMIGAIPALSVPTLGLSVPIGGAIGGAIGNTVKQFREMARGEKEDFSYGELAGTSAVSAVPGSGLVKAFKGVGARAVAGNAAKAAVEGAALSVGQKMLETAIDKRELPSWGELRWTAAGGLTFGAGLSAVGAIGKRLLGKTPQEAKVIVDDALEAAQSQDERVKLSELQQFINDSINPPKAEPKKTAIQHSIDELPGATSGESAQDAAKAFVADVPPIKSAKESAGPLYADQAQREIAQYNAANLATDAAIGKITLSPQAQRMMEEYGRVDPAVMKALAYGTMRGGAGFAVGAQYGDTPEERLANGLAAASAGVVLSPALARKVGRKMVSTEYGGWVASKTLPELVAGELNEPLKGLPAMKASLERDGLRATKLLSKELAAHPNETDKVEQYINGNLHITNLSPSVAKAAQAVRDATDDLSDRLVQTGLAQGELRDTVIANIGRYMRRSFRLFEEPHYKPDQKDFDNFVAEYVAEKVAAGSNVPRAELDQAGQDLARTLLSRGPDGVTFDAAGEYIRSGSATIAKSGELFKPRKRLADATLRLLGEIKDPVDRAALTIPKMAELLAADDMQKKLREIGLRTGQFTEKSSATHSVPLAKKGSGQFDQLTDLWTTPAISKALGQLTRMDDLGAGWRVLATATGWAKMSKTVLNAESYAPNLISAMLAPIKNGHVTAAFNAKNLNDAGAIIFDEIGLSTAPKSLEKDIKFLTEQRIIKQSLSFNDLTRTINGAYLPTVPGAKAGKKVLNALGSVFGGSEDTGRILTFYAERERYKLAYPNMPQEQLNLKAAAVTRAVAENYSEIPGMVKKAAVGGVLNTFVNFSYEQFRTAYNAAKIGLADMAEGAATKNEELVKAGAKRLAAITAMTAAGSAWGLSAYSKRKAGVSDEQEAALRRRAPAYDQSGVWYMHNLTKDQFAYSNQSYILPSSIVGEAISAAARGDTPVDAAKNFALALWGQLGGDGGVVMKPALQAMFDQNDFGRRISTPESGELNQLKERGEYFLGRAFQPLIVSQIGKLVKAYNNEKGPDGQLYRLEDRMDRMMGIRVNRLDLPHQFERQAFGFSQRLADLGKSANSVEKKDPAQAYKLKEEGRQKVFSDLQLYVHDAAVLGQDSEKTIRNLRNAGIPSDLLLGVLDGKYRPGMADDGKPSVADVVRSMKLLPKDQQKAEFNRIALEDRGLAKAVVNEMRSGQKDAALGITQYDELIRNLNTDKRAKYIQERMDDMATPGERKQWLLYLKSKRLLTPDVYQRLTEQRLVR